MNCEALAEIILDMARGAAVPEAARLSVRRHTETCPSCAAEYARQRDLTTALQALAAEAQEWTAPAAMEQRLLAELAARQGREVPVAGRATTGRWRYTLATAAALTLAVWGLKEAWEPANRGTAEPAGKAAAGGAEGSAATRAPMVETARPPGPTVLAPVTVGAANPPSRVALPPSPSLQRTSRRGRPAVGATSQGNEATPIEFVRIPSAIGLPELESGTVLRMELPLTALPEYGLDIAPDAMRTSIEADVLVGQDGQPRAIRLVGIPDTVAQDPRSRQ